MVVEDDLALADLRRSWENNHRHIKPFLDYLIGYQECPGECGRPELEMTGRGRATVTWGAPVVVGTSGIIAYRLEVAYDDKPNRWISLGLTPHCHMDVSGLEEGGLWLRVSASNTHGYGEPRQSPLYYIRQSPSPPICVSELQCKAYGNHLVLACQVTGYPIPMARWSRGQEDIEDLGRIMVERDDDIYRLTILEATKDDNGLYCLEAVNSEGRATSYCFVSVEKKPELTGTDESIYRRPVDVEKPPAFSLELKDRTADAFATVVLSCQVTGNPKPTVTWQKNGQSIQADENVKYRSDGDYHSLELERANPDDCGEYSCTAENNLGTVTTSCTLNIEGPIDPPSFLHELEKSKTAIEGDTIRISATLNPSLIHPTISWFRDEEEIKPRKERVMTHSADGTVELCLAHLTLSDSGVYNCTATSPAGSATSYCAVTIISKPSTSPKAEYSCIPYSEVPLFITKPRCSDVVEGETIRFRVQVVGDPIPKVEWYRDTLKVEYFREKDQFSIGNEGADHWLEVRRCKLHFSGHYLAQATNRHGYANARFSLQVFAQDERRNIRMNAAIVKLAEIDCLPLVTRPLGDAQCIVGKPVTLECRIKGEPQPGILWKKDGIVFKQGKKAIEGEAVTLTLEETKPHHQGIYKCEAFNPLGKASTSAFLSVQEKEEEAENQVSPCVTREAVDPETLALRGRRATPARFLTVPHDRVVLAGDPVRLICSGYGYPLPSATWYKDSVLIESVRLRISEDGDLYTLEIAEARTEDAGKYTVILENIKGRAEASATIQVVSHRKENKMVSKDHHQFGRRYRDQRENKERDTQPEQPIQECTATEGSTFTLSCHIGTSSTATWYKDGEPMREETAWEEDGLSRLRLGPLSPADTGLYSCRLSQEWGLAQGLVRLTVTPIKHQEIRPPIFTKGLPRELTAQEGQPVLISATVSGEEPLKIVWSRGGTEIPDCDDMRHVETGNGEVALRIADAFVQDAGLYTCSVYNSHGMAQSHTRLIVKEESNQNEEEVPAKILRGPTDCIALRENKAVLSARFTGKPRPTLMWSKGGVELSTGNRLKIETDNEMGESRLIIDPVEADDSGKYVLTVYNHLATVYHFASLSVEGVPDPPADRPVADLRPSGIDVTWSSPYYDGGSMITGYSVEVSEDTIWRTIADRCHSLSHTIYDLKKGKTYKFRVRSHNTHGPSEPSLESEPISLPENGEIGPVEFEDGSLFFERYDKLEELGKGRYGTVHKIKDKMGSEFAAKTVRCIKKEDRDKAAQEVDIMNALRHPKLLQLIAAYNNPREMILVLEYISGGELFERVVADDFTLTEKDCILFMRQICKGVQYMHSQSVVHLDLKPENIMCTTRDSHEIKLIDFGLAQKLSGDIPVRVLFGTPEFIAPEIINYEPIGTQTDMWSVGVICYVLLSGLSPFMGDNDAETFANITRADFDFEDDSFDSISNTAKEFISELLVKRKEKRLTAAECLKHSWMSQEDTEMSQIKLSTDKLKKFIIRRKWQKTGNAIRALGRMANLSAASRRGSHQTSMSKTSNESVKRGRQCSERSDSGFSDCSTTGSLSATPSHLLQDKKYSISEEIEDNLKLTKSEKVLESKGNVEGLKKTDGPKFSGKRLLGSKTTNENVQKAFAFWNR